jgi:cytidylate kinase
MTNMTPQHVESVLTALRLEAFAQAAGTGETSISGCPRPFATISRQAGAGGKTVAAMLAEALNRIEEPANASWCAWDQELVTKVAADFAIPEAAVESLEDQNHPLLREIISSLVSEDHCNEFKVYRRVARTIRALAGAGRAIIVGRGGVFLTAEMPAGVHVRLIAPLADRVARTAERLQISQSQAAARVQEIDRNREAFYHRHWPTKRVNPEAFCLTINTAAMSDEQIVACLLPLLASSNRIAALARPRCVSPCGSRQVPERNAVTQEPSRALG